MQPLVKNITFQCSVAFLLIDALRCAICWCQKHGTLIILIHIFPRCYCTLPWLVLLELKLNTGEKLNLLRAQKLRKHTYTTTTRPDKWITIRMRQKKITLYANETHFTILTLGISLLSFFTYSTMTLCLCRMFYYLLFWPFLTIKYHVIHNLQFISQIFSCKYTHQSHNDGDRLLIHHVIISLL